MQTSSRTLPGNVRPLALAALSLAIVGALVAPASADASAFQLKENSAKAMGCAYAGSATAGGDVSAAVRGWMVETGRLAPDATLTHRELSTFTSLAFTVCREISFALVCTTTARLPGLLSDLPRLGDLTSETWTALDAAFFASLRESLATAAPPPLPVARTPLPHQLTAIAAAHTHYVERAATRGKLISPCGSGKSLTACWIAEKLAARRVLIAVPSIALIRQTLETWMREALARGQPADWLCVCSDADVAKTERAELVAHVHELGLPTTQPAQLAAALAALRDHPGQVVVLTTYQSSPVLAAAARDAAFAFDLAVLDEAHRTTGRRAKNFSHLLFDQNLPLPRRLFMTATERRFQGSSDEIVSMDDPALYGDTFALLTFRDAIAATPPILSDYASSPSASASPTSPASSPPTAGSTSVPTASTKSPRKPSPASSPSAAPRANTACATPSPSTAASPARNNSAPSVPTSTSTRSFKNPFPTRVT